MLHPDILHLAEAAHGKPDDNLIPAVLADALDEHGHAEVAAALRHFALEGGGLKWGRTGKVAARNARPVAGYYIPTTPEGYQAWPTPHLNQSLTDPQIRIGSFIARPKVTFKKLAEAAMSNPKLKPLIDAHLRHFGPTDPSSYRITKLARPVEPNPLSIFPTRQRQVAQAIVDAIGKYPNTRTKDLPSKLATRHTPEDIAVVLSALMRHGHINVDPGAGWKLGPTESARISQEFASADPEHVNQFLHMITSPDAVTRRFVAPDFVIDHMLPESEHSWRLHTLLKNLDDRIPTVHTAEYRPHSYEHFARGGLKAHQPQSGAVIHQLVLPHTDPTRVNVVTWPARRSEVTHITDQRYSASDSRFHPEPAVKLARPVAQYQSLADALQHSTSQNSKAKINAVNALIKAAEESGSAVPVVHHHPRHGFHSTVAASIAGTPYGNESIAKYLGAWAGLITQHPEIVAFEPDENGPDAVHILKGDSPRQLADQLRAAGHDRFSLTSTAPYHAFLFDEGAKIGRFSNGSIRRGRGHSVGDRNGSGSDSRANYREAIRSIEPTGVSPEASGNAAVAAAPVTKLARYIVAWKDKNHVVHKREVEAANATDAKKVHKEAQVVVEKRPVKLSRVPVTNPHLLSVAHAAHKRYVEAQVAVEVKNPTKLSRDPADDITDASTRMHQELCAAKPEHVRHFIDMVTSPDANTRHIAADYVLDHLLGETETGWKLHHLVRNLGDRQPVAGTAHRLYDPTDLAHPMKLHTTLEWRMHLASDEDRRPRAKHQLMLPHPDNPRHIAVLHWPATRSETKERFSAIDNAQYHPELVKLAKPQFLGAAAKAVDGKARLKDWISRYVKDARSAPFPELLEIAEKHPQFFHDVSPIRKAAAMEGSGLLAFNPYKGKLHVVEGTKHISTDKLHPRVVHYPEGLAALINSRGHVAPVRHGRAITAPLHTIPVLGEDIYHSYKMKHPDDPTRTPDDAAQHLMDRLHGNDKVKLNRLPVTNPSLLSVAESYAGKPLTADTSTPTMDESRLWAQKYEAAKHRPHDPEVAAAYAAMADETRKQWHHLQSHGYKMEPSSRPMYKNSAEMTADVVNNKHLWYDPTSLTGYGEGTEKDTPDHPLLALSPEGIPYNDMFRAVHDVFGHALHGHTFGRVGEERAYQDHKKMFSPLAVKALTSETKGQNSWVNAGPHSHLPVTERPYAEQKATIL